VAEGKEDAQRPAFQELDLDGLAARQAGLSRGLVGVGLVPRRECLQEGDPLAKLHRDARGRRKCQTRA